MKTENKKKNTFIIVAVVLGAIVALALQVLFLIWLFSISTTDFEIKKNGEVSINDGDFTISKDVNGYYNEEDKCYYLESKLINNTDEDYDYIDITYTFYDNEGYILGNGYAYLDNIKENGKWKFKVTYCDNGADTVSDYELTSVDLY